MIALRPPSLLAALLLLATCAGGCATGPPREPRPFWWLAGTWTTGSDEGNRRAEEHWAPPASNAMVGINRTLEDDLMVAYEFLRISDSGDRGVIYFASPGGRYPPTPFPLVDYSDEHAIFENLEHDFPQRIIYRRIDRNRLVARIEGTVDGETRSMEWRYHRPGTEAR